MSTAILLESGQRIEVELKSTRPPISGYGCSTHGYATLRARINTFRRQGFHDLFLISGRRDDRDFKGDVR